MAEVKFSHSAIILDACCAINLYASGKMEDIIATVPCNFFIADYVMEKEATMIAGMASQSNIIKKEAIDLQPFIDHQLLKVVSLTGENEHIDLLEFTYERLDDGEAITAAIAKNRNLGIATDDKRGINVFGKKIPHIQIVTTPELVKYWHDIKRPNTEETRVTLDNIRYKGKYYPSNDHQLHNWWKKNSQAQ